MVAWLVGLFLVVGSLFLIGKNIIPENQTHVNYGWSELSLVTTILCIGGFFAYFIAIFWSIILGFSLQVRRLHDLNRSGLWVLISHIPYVYCLLMLYLLCAKGTIGANEYGEDLIRRDQSYEAQKSSAGDGRFSR